MNNIFSYDSKFFEKLGEVSNIIILNFIFIISCVPVVTIGVSITSLYYVAMKMVKKQEIYILKEYIKVFKENFKISTIVWFIMIMIGGILVVDVYLVTLVSNELISNIVKLVFTMISILYIFTITYVFPIISKFDNSIKNTIINSILISIQNLPYTIIIIILNLSPLLLISLFSSQWGNIIFFYTVIGFGIIIYINSILFEKIFNKLINK